MESESIQTFHDIFSQFKVIRRHLLGAVNKDLILMIAWEMINLEYEPGEKLPVLLSLTKISALNATLQLMDDSNWNHIIIKNPIMDYNN